MVEMIVALVIIGIIMTALGSFFVSTVSATSRQGSSQAAVQLADDAIERVRAMDPTAIATGRDQTSSTTQWNAPVTGVAAYETGMSMAYDPNVTSGGATATLPTVGSPVTVNGLTYKQNWYIGKCWQPWLSGGSCTVVANPTSNTYASFYRVVVAITWSDSICTSSACVFIATTLVSNALNDPQFNSNLVAQAPSVVNPGNQSGDTGAAALVDAQFLGRRGRDHLVVHGPADRARAGRKRHLGHADGDRHILGRGSGHRHLRAERHGNVHLDDRRPAGADRGRPDRSAGSAPATRRR